MKREISFLSLFWKEGSSLKNWNMDNIPIFELLYDGFWLVSRRKLKVVDERVERVIFQDREFHYLL